MRAWLLLLAAGCGSGWRTVDLDGDGWTVAQGDCWDDVEGPAGSGLGGADIHPGAEETWYDGIDQDCAGDDDYDADGDGWVPEEWQVGAATLGVPGSGENHLGGGDCWDVPGVTPEEFVPVTTDYDRDGNPYPRFEAADVHPGAADTWYDGVDSDCAGNDDFDQDGDGFATAMHLDRSGEPAGDDCVDGSWREDPLPDDVAPADVHPGATEVCNDVDDDCNGLADSDDPGVDPASQRAFYPDADADGFGDAGAAATMSCETPDGMVEDATDCDDGDAAVHPGAAEVCDGQYDDCDDPSWTADAAPADETDDDGDGYVECAWDSGTWAGSSSVVGGGDCDDANADAHPGLDELCNGFDDDCDGATDEDDALDASDWYADVDGDGYGDAGSGVHRCEAPTGYVADATDCDDGDSAVHPGADEWCNGFDDDCDGTTDEPDALDASDWYADADGDGYGDPATSVHQCSAPSGYVSDSTDCDDADASVNPGATEVCNSGRDDDCDGLADDDDGDVDLSTGSTFYADADGDGYGDAASSTVACAQPTGYVTDATDCDDAHADAHPGLDEVCNDGLDNDCDGTLGTTAAGGTCALADGTVADANLTVSAGDGSTALAQRLELGDVNGDGLADLLLGAPDYDYTASKTNAGAVYVVFGSASIATVGTSAALATSAADATITSQAKNEYVGMAVAAGDIDGDSVDDLVIGGPEAGSNDAGAVYVFYGPLTAGLSMAAAYADCSWTGTTSDAKGGAALAVGDLDGLAGDEIVVGLPGSRVPTTAGSVAGSAVLLTGGCSMTETATYGGDGSVGDDAGASLALVDLDGDGTPELAAGAPDPGSATGAGAVYVLDAGTADLTWSDGLTLEGENARDRAGFSVAAAGDVDGDGVDDLLVGAFYGGSGYAGKAYVVAGSTTAALTGTESLGTSSRVVATFTTSQASARVGSDVAGAGDVDGDGVDDLLVSARQYDSGATNTGAVALFYGPVSGALAFDSDADVFISGDAASDELGHAVAGGADVNGDGVPDLLLGAPYVDASLVETNAGAAYLFLGLQQ